MLIRRSLSGAVAALLFASAAQSAPLNDTGQLRCFDETATSTGSVGVNANPESAGFVGQDCSYGGSAADAEGVLNKTGGSSVSGRDYTKVANDGSELPSNATLGSGASDWRCTRDNTTGLTWLLRLGGEQTATYTYAQASTLVTAANNDAACGITDWALPQPAHFESVFAYHDPAGSNNLIDRTWFPDQTNPGAFFFFWTQASQDGVESFWVADFGTGQMTADLETNPAFVRLVSGTQSPSSPRFSTADPQSNGEVVVEDADTGLMWKQCPEGLSGATCTGGSIAFKDWSTALTDAGAVSFAGYDDWRLPNIIELASIRDYSPKAAGELALPGAFLVNNALDTYWSSTNVPLAGSATSALAYRFEGSQAHSTQGKTSPIAVRLVRGGSFPAQYVAGSDIEPDAFSFAGADAAADTLVDSADIAVSGIDSASPISVSGAAESAYSLDGGTSWLSADGVVTAGGTVRVRHRSAATEGQTATTTLTIGGVSAGFVSTAAGVPDAPTIDSATSGDGVIDITFSQPADNGSAITDYTASITPSGGSPTTQACGSPPSTSCQISGVTNGVQYSIALTATNGIGESAPSNTVQATPAGLAGAPQSVEASQTALTSAELSFTAPDDGGSPIVSYTVAIGGDASATLSCLASPCEVTGLIAGGDYTFSIFATNDLGDGPSSATADLALVTAPVIALEGQARDGEATFTVSAPTNVGSGFANEYRFVFNSGGSSSSQMITVNAGSASFTGLPLGDLQVTAFAQLDAGLGIQGESPPGQTAFTMPAGPTIQFVGIPRSVYSMNHNDGTVNFATGDIVLEVDDPDSTQAPSFSVVSSNPTLLPVERDSNRSTGEYFYGFRGQVRSTPQVADENGARKWSVALQPTVDNTGSSTLTFTVEDSDGLRSSESLEVTFEPNAVPTASIDGTEPSVLSLRREVTTASFSILPDRIGMSYQSPSFLNSFTPVEPDQTVTGFELVAIKSEFDPDTRELTYVDVTDTVQPELDTSTGTISMAQVPELGIFNFKVILWPVDDGFGDVSICTGENRLAYAKEADLIVEPMLFESPKRVGPCGRRYTIFFSRGLAPPPYTNVSTGSQQLDPLSGVPIRKGGAGESTMLYRVVVENPNEVRLDALRLVVPVPNGLNGVSWTCVGTAEPCLVPSGSGAVDVGFDLGAGEAVAVDIVGALSPSTAYVSLRPELVSATGVDLYVPGNGRTRVDPVSNDYIFADRLE
jgi:hypothetical protein